MSAPCFLHGGGFFMAYLPAQRPPYVTPQNRSASHPQALPQPACPIITINKTKFSCLRGDGQRTKNLFFMSRKFILAAALSAGAAFGAAAQEPITFGARVGLNFDSYKESGGGSSETSDNKVGFHIGGVADIPLAGYAPSLPAWFYFQPGVYITSKGGKVSESESGVSYKSTVSLYYLELPLRASAKLALTDDINVRALFGPSIGVALSGKEKMEQTANGQTQSKEGDIFDDDDSSRFHFGLDFGAGVEYRQLYFGLGYDLGLSSLYSGDGSWTNSTFGLSVGYNF